MISPQLRAGRVATDHVQRARTVHVAEGLLMGLLGTPLDDALATLISVGRASRLSTYRIANALVSAVNTTQPLDRDDPATAAVLHHWGREIRTRDFGGRVTR